MRVERKVAEARGSHTDRGHQIGLQKLQRKVEGGRRRSGAAGISGTDARGPISWVAGASLQVFPTLGLAEQLENVARNRATRSLVGVIQPLEIDVGSRARDPTLRAHR